jgi:hypothetical protein
VFLIEFRQRQTVRLQCSRVASRSIIAPIQGRAERAAGDSTTLGNLPHCGPRRPSRSLIPAISTLEPEIDRGKAVLDGKVSGGAPHVSAGDVVQCCA